MFGINRPNIINAEAVALIQRIPDRSCEWEHINLTSRLLESVISGADEIHLNIGL